MTYFETLIKDARREADDSEYGTANLLRDLAVSLEVMVAESESLRKQLDGTTERTYTEWKATWRPQWVERKGEPVENDPGATGLSKEDALHNLMVQTQGGDFPGLRFWTRSVVRPTYGPWVEVE